MPLEIDYYNLDIHKLMLRDKLRCETFRRALSEIVQPGYTVLDVGAGTGLLSIFAAQAGARIVYAVERTNTAELARQIISANGLDNSIRIYQNNMKDVSLPEKVDVIVSEWLGGYGVDENLLPVVVLARDRWLKPEGKVIPRKVTSWLAPGFDELLQQDIEFWDGKPYGLQLGTIARSTIRELHCCRNHIKQNHILCKPKAMWEIDVKSCSIEEATQLFSADMEFVVPHNGQFNCLAAWFTAELSDQITLSNEPSEQYTHWGRWVFPIGRNICMESGKRVAVQFAVEPKSKGQSKAKWAIEVEGYRFSSEDITVLKE